HKDAKGYDEEVDDGLYEMTVGKHVGSCGFCFFEGGIAGSTILARSQYGKLVLEAGAACGHAYKRHQDIIYHCSYDLAESSTDDDGYGEIHDVALKGESFKI